MVAGFAEKELGAGLDGLDLVLHDAGGGGDRDLVAGGAAEDGLTGGGSDGHLALDGVGFVGVHQEELHLPAILLVDQDDGATETCPNHTALVLADDYRIL